MIKFTFARIKSFSFLFGFVFISFGCSLNRASSDNLLDKRADYLHREQIKAELNSAETPLILPTKTKAIITDIWVHPYQLKDGDLFRGGWIRSIISRANWKLSPNKRPLIPPKTVKSSSSRRK